MFGNVDVKQEPGNENIRKC